MSNESSSVAVLLFPQAVEAIAGALGGHIREGDFGPHILCRQVNSNGPYFEMLFDGQDASGRPVEMEVMLPHGYIRMVMSVRGEDSFGFARVRQTSVPAQAMADTEGGSDPG